MRQKQTGHFRQKKEIYPRPCSASDSAAHALSSVPKKQNAVPADSGRSIVMQMKRNGSRSRRAQQLSRFQRPCSRRAPALALSNFARRLSPARFALCGEIVIRRGGIRPGLPAEDGLMEIGGGKSASAGEGRDPGALPASSRLPRRLFFT